MFRLLILLMFLSFGCSKSNQAASVTAQNDMSKSTGTNLTHSLGQVLSSDARQLVDNWEEYSAVEELILQYYNISVTDALAKANELSVATQQLTDSIRVERFERPDLKIRLNILNNSALRLNDLSQINEVETEEIKTEVRNLVGVFSSINTKLNTIVINENLEKELKSFD